MSEPATAKLNDWLAHLGSGDLPILNETDRQIAAISRQESTTAAELANVILRDPAMTSQVLRVANTAFYNPALHQRINSISRAVVVLGFNAIFSIRVSKTLLDGFGLPDAHREVLAAIARALHAGVQARAFAETLGEKEPEDVFIAALLYHLGDIVLWTHAPQEASKIQERVRAGGYTAESAQREILGFTTAELTLALSREWQLSSLLELALEPDTRNQPLSRLIAAANRVSEVIARGHREAVSPVAEEVATLLKRPVRETRDLLFGSLQSAKELVTSYGLNADLLEEPQPHPEGPGKPAKPEQGPRPEEREAVQLQILADIAAMLNERAGIGVLLETVVEGIYRGVDMDRAALMLLSKDRQQLSAKFALGAQHESLLDILKFRLDDLPWVRRVLATGQPVWYDPKDRQDQPGSAFRRAVGEGEFFIMPIGIPGRMIGVLYGDRHSSRRPLTGTDFGSFRLFGQQASLGLAYLERQHAP